MKKEIKERIEAVRRGEVPGGYCKVQPYVIPNGWKVVKLGGVTKRTSRPNKDGQDRPAYSINNRKGFVPQNEQFEEGSYEDLDKSAYKIVRKGEFAYNPARVNVGSIGRLRDAEEVAVSSLYVCVSVDDKVDGEYFDAWTKSRDFYKETVRNTEGSVREYLFYENFANMRIPIPTVAEQQKIAEILATCDRAIELKQQLLEEKQKAFRHLMAQIFNRANGYKELGKVAKITMGQSPDSSSYNTDEDGVPLLQGNADISNGFPAPRYYTNQPTKMCMPGDLLLSVRAPVGEVSHSDRSACIGRGLCSIRAGKFTEFIYYYLRYYEPEWNKISQGSTFTAISGDDIKKVQIPAVDDITLNRSINILRCADNEIQLLKQELSAWQQKEKALMQLLLTGLVRVNA